jgi:hypothetical protein
MTNQELSRAMCQKLQSVTGEKISYNILKYWENGNLQNELVGKSLRALAIWKGETTAETTKWLWQDASDLRLFEIMAWIDTTTEEDLLKAQEAIHKKLNLTHDYRYNSLNTINNFDASPLEQFKEIREDKETVIFCKRLSRLMECSLAKHSELRGKPYHQVPGTLAKQLGCKGFRRTSLSAALNGNICEGGSKSGQVLCEDDWNAIASICFKCEFQGIEPELYDITYAGNVEALKAALYSGVGCHSY